jgi:hypothetical protein
MKKSIFLRFLPVVLVISLLFSTFSFGSLVSAASYDVVGSSVQTINGQPAFVINYGAGGNVVMDDILYDTYHFTKKNVQNMADNGTKTFSFVTTFADSADLWTKPVWVGQNAAGANIFDYSVIDDNIDMALDVAPDAKFLLRLYMGVPESWLNQVANADARAVTMNAAGTTSYYYADNGITKSDRYYYSINSAKAISTMGAALQEAITRIETKYPGKIIGYNITGLSTEELYRHGWHSTTFDDYSTASLTAFRTFLTTKYGTDAALRTAWTNGTITLATAQLPVASRRVAATISGSNFLATSTNMDLIDFYQFYNESVPNFIDSVCAYAKAAVPSKIVGVTYGYEYEFGGDPGSGENALGKLAKSTHIDFVKFEAGANYRYSGTGGDNYRGPADSVMLNGKVTMLDNDSATSLFASTDAFINDTQAQKDALAVSLQGTNALTTTPALSGAIQKRIIGFAATNGFVPTFFDLHGGYYNDTTIRKAMAEAEQMYKSGMTYDRTSAAQILLVTDEVSCGYLKMNYINDGNTAMAEDMRRVTKNLMKSGMPYDSIVVNDLNLANLSQYKLIYFMNSYNATAAQRTLIDSCKGGGRTVVFAYAPGYFTNQATSVATMTSMVGMTMATDTAGTNQVYIPNNTDFGVILQGITGATSTTFSTARSTDLFKVADATATTIGKTTSAGQINMAYKRFGTTWTSMYVPFAGLSTDIFRAIGQFAGVFIYTQRFNLSEDLKYDTISVGKNLIYLHANGTKSHTIYFPVSSDVYDPITNVKTDTAVTSKTISMNDGETVAIRIQNTGTAPFSVAAAIPNIIEPLANSRTNNGCLKVVKDTNYSYGNWGKAEYKFLNLTVGNTYKVSYWAKIPSPEAGQSLTATLGWYAGGGTTKDFAYPILTNASYAVTDGEWHYYTSSVTIPAQDLTPPNPKPGTSPYYSLMIYSGVSSGTLPSWSTMYLDDVQMIQVNADLTPYSGATGLIASPDFTSLAPVSNWCIDASFLSIDGYTEIPEVHSGYRSMKVNKNSPRAAYTGLSLTSGVTYTLTYWVKTNNTSFVGATFGTTVQGSGTFTDTSTTNIISGGYGYSTAPTNAWRQYSATIIPSTTASNFYVAIDSRPLDPYFYIDDVVLTAAGSGTNLIADGNFETATRTHFGGDSNDWMTANWVDNAWCSEYAYQVHVYGQPDGPRVLYVVNSTIHSGSKSLRVNGATAQADCTGITLTSGITYTFTYWVKTEAGASVGLVLSTDVQGSGSPTDKTSMITSGGGYNLYTATDALWHQYTATIVPTATSTIYSLGIDSRPTTATPYFFIDDVVLTAAGNQTNLISDAGFETATQAHFGGGNGYGWTTANWVDGRWYSAYAFGVHFYGEPDRVKALYIV